MRLTPRSLGGLAAVLAAGAWLLGAPPARADNLDDELMKQSTALAKLLESKGAKTVGVLKFQAGKGDDKTTLTLGPINSIMAERIESVLVIRTARANRTSYQVIRDASGFAASKRQKVNHLTAEGRKKLFDLEFPLYAGDKPAKADLFLTGEVRLDPKTHKTTVLLTYFDRESKEITPVPDLDNPKLGIRIEVPTDRAILADAGQGFVLSKRSMTKKGADDDLFADQDAQRREEKKDTVLKDPERLVELKMFVNGEEVPFQPDEDNPGDGRFTTRDPKEGDKVTFRIAKKTKDRIAVVLKVNGMNTLYEQKDEAKFCTKWIFDADDKPITVKGFYINHTGKENLIPFKVLPDDDPAAEPLTNGEAGTISLHVFLEGTAEKEDEEIKTRGLSQGLWASAKSRGMWWEPKKRTMKTTSDAGATLIANQSKTRKKGLIGKEDNPVDGSKLKTVDFENPQEKEVIFLRYFKPKKGGL